MNTYSSGYTLAGLLKVFGWIFIAASAIIGISVYANAPRDFEYIGFFVFLAGAFQGIILLGIGAIGEAILDGARFQGEVLDILKVLARNGNTSSVGAPSLNVGLDNRRRVDSKISTTEGDDASTLMAIDEKLKKDNEGFTFNNHYFGYTIRRHPNGYIVGDVVFEDIFKAYRLIDSVIKQKKSDGNSKNSI